MINDEEILRDGTYTHEEDDTPMDPEAEADREKSKGYGWNQGIKY